MDIGKSFSYVFEDEEWIKKLLIGGIVAFIPIVFFAAFGYVIQIVRNIADGYERPLPEWDEFGKYFIDGLKFFIGLLVYYIPLLLIICCFSAITIALGNSMNSSDADTVMPILTFCFMPLIFILALLPYLVIPALLARYAETDRLGEMFRFGEIWTFIRGDLGNYLIVLLLAFVVTSFIAPLGIILFCVGVIFTQWWAYLVIGHLTGQLLSNRSA